MSCLTLDQAMDSFGLILKSILRNLDSSTPNALQAKKVFPVGDELMLLIPDHVLTDGHMDTKLPGIPGRLLEYLAAHPGEILPATDLKRVGWGVQAGVSHAVLHQQMYVLREILDIYGARWRMESFRGRGYSLDVTGRTAATSRPAGECRGAKTGRDTYIGSGGRRSAAVSRR